MLDVTAVLAKKVEDMTAEEMQFLISYTSKLTAVKKAAKEKGIIVSKPAKSITEKAPEFQLLASALEAVVLANQDYITTLFNATKTAEKRLGNKGINVSLAGCNFNVQLLSKEVYKAEAAENKAKKEALATDPLEAVKATL